jgi:hypothetical protein
MKNILSKISILFCLIMVSPSWAQEPTTMTISNTKAEPATVTSGTKVVISCKVNHPDPMQVERVAASISVGGWNASYPMLYDDGTNGDSTSEDRIYSLEINAPETAGEGKIIFYAVDKDKNEIVSEPIIMTVQ